VKIILSGKVSKAYVVKDKAISATKGAKSAVEAAGGRSRRKRASMATSSASAASALGDMTRFQEMRKRLLVPAGALVVYRIGTFIPVPGIDAARFAAFSRSAGHAPRHVQHVLRRRAAALQHLSR